jgi:hypothetical protein
MIRLYNSAVLLILVFTFSPAWAFDSRLQIDPDVSLVDLSASPGAVTTTLGRNINIYWTDSSAVLRVDSGQFLAASLDYNRYVEFGMPHLKSSHIVERVSPELLYTWASLSYIMFSSKHYLEIRVHPRVGNIASCGIEWQLAGKKPEWKYPEDSAFSHSDGSLFIQPLDNGMIYVRYYFSNDVNIPLGRVVSPLIQRKLRQGAADVIKTLSKQAALITTDK